MHHQGRRPDEDAKPTAAVDAAGMESRHTSRYFFKHGRERNSRLWTKLAVACDTASHYLFAAATVSPSALFQRPRRSSALPWPRRRWRSIMTAYSPTRPFDGEESHRYGRKNLGVRSTVIPLEPAEPGSEVAQDPLPAADGEAVPQEAAGQ